MYRHIRLTAALLVWLSIAQVAKADSGDPAPAWTPPVPSSAAAQTSTMMNHAILVYEPSTLIAGTWANDNTSLTIHDVGVELALPQGPILRYHFTVAFSDFILGDLPGVYGVSMKSTELGWAIPVLNRGAFHLDIEPTFSPVNVAYNTSGDGSLFLLSASIGVNVNFDWGLLHCVVKPVNFDVIYLSYTFGAPGVSVVQTPLSLMYRFGVGVGLNY